MGERMDDWMDGDGHTFSKTRMNRRRLNFSLFLFSSPTFAVSFSSNWQIYGWLAGWLDGWTIGRWLVPCMTTRPASELPKGTTAIGPGLTV